MAKSTIQYHCQSCGSVFPKWSGKCDGCGEWNTLVEERNESRAPGQKRASRSRQIELHPLSEKNPEQKHQRFKSGIDELDRVTGGGFVPGSALLIGGDPGIGKSTLLLQLVCLLAKSGRKTAYITGEESVEQVRMRAERLGIADVPALLAAATNVGDIAETAKRHPDLDLLVIDSIQTMYLSGLDSAPGTVSQVRAAAHELIRVAKSSSTINYFCWPCHQGWRNRRPQSARAYGRCGIIF